MEVHAYAAFAAKEKLAPFIYEAPPLKPYEVLIRVSHCGICHSDVHLIDNDWNRSTYPLVPGHEVIGEVFQKGELSTHNIGSRVGISWVHSACMLCPTCIQGDTNICPQKTMTCVGRYGGFADYMIADSRFAYLIPDQIDSAHAAPLLCAGATVYAPLIEHGIQGGHSVGVIGVGGLGHLAIQFASDLGCDVTAISHSPSKEKEAKSFGANQFISLASSIPTNQFDFILSTVHVDLDWNLILSLLKPKGTLCFVGRIQNQMVIDQSPLISSQKKICGSATANRAIMMEMLSFAARHQIKPQIEKISLKEVNFGVNKVKANQARYRIVLEV